MAEDPLTVHARARVGRTLRSKWTLDRLIGVGGMAAVYEATHRNGSKVAIKMLHPTLMYDTNFAQRLVQEGYVANKINHPAAVRVHDDDTDETDGTVFLVMELLEGQTLSQTRRKRKRIPPIEAFKMLDPVLECLGNAHEKGIIHRDIKPENLFVSKGGSVRVLDFGIARMSDGSNVSATRTGMVVGSPAYMSPEQALGKMNSVGPQTDVYALGATLFALITGVTPHAGESTQEMIVMVATQSARSITSVMPDVPPCVARVIDKSLAYDRDKRHANAREMLEEMRAAVRELEGGPSRVLPTFSDDDDEGATTVSGALKQGDNAEEAKGPLPAAGANRVGSRPPTGKFNLPPMPPAVPAPSTEGAGSATPPSMRPPTLAPTGAPTPAALTPSVRPPSGAHVAPGVASGPHVLPGHTSAPSPLDAFSSEMNPAARPPPEGAPAFPPTMAIPVMSPAEIAASTGPGVSSGQRPGATTNMAWATPPASGVPEEPAPVKKPRVGLFAAAAAGVLALGGVAFATLGGGNETPTPSPTSAPRTVRPVQPPPPVRPVVAPVVAAPQTPTPVPTPAVVQPTPAVVADAGAAPIEPTTPPEVAVAQPEPDSRSERRHSRERNRERTAERTTERGNERTTTRRARERHPNPNPLGY